MPLYGGPIHHRFSQNTQKSLAKTFCMILYYIKVKFRGGLMVVVCGHFFAALLKVWVFWYKFLKFNPKFDQSGYQT